MSTRTSAGHQASLCAVLRAVCAVSAHAASRDEALDAMLAVLTDAGLATGAVIEVVSSPPVRWSAGDAGPLIDANPSMHAVPGVARPAVRTEPVPGDHGAPAFLHVAPARRLSRDLIPAIAAQVGLTLDRWRWTEEARDAHLQTERRILEVSTIYEIGQAVDSVEFDRLLEFITVKAAKVMDAQACSLMRLNPETRALTIAASYGLSEDVVFVTQRALGEGIAGRVAQTGEPLLIRDRHTDPRLSGVTLRPDIGSSMLVPMKDDHGQVTGVLSIRRRRPAPDFDEGDLRLFSVFARQAAFAVNNKQLYDDVRRRVRELSTVSDLTQAVISHLDLDSLLNHVADNIVDVVKLDRCCIFLLDRHTRRFVPRILRGYRSDVIGRNPVRLGEGVVGIVARKQLPIVENDARNALQPMRGFARSLGTNSFLAIPIVSRGQAIGVVVADNRLSARAIQPDAVELLTTFVNQAGIAIENAQLYEDREQRYQEMNRLATQTDNILRSIAASVIVVDASGRVTRWNKASEELWALPEEEATRLNWGCLVDRLGLPVEEAGSLRALMEKVSRSRRPEQVHKRTFNSERVGPLTLDILLSPLIDRQGEHQGAVAIMEDVTHEIRMEAEMERMRRLAAIGRLAATMAHEVRNPLSSIKGAAQLMRNDAAQPVALTEFLDIIIDEVNTLNQITTELLDFARPMLLDLCWTDLTSLIERTLRFMAADLSGASVVAHTEFGPDLPIVLADPKQLEQVLRNMIINSVQAMPDGGDLWIEAVSGSDAGRAVIRVRDTGIGIPPDKIEEVFQPFMTTKTKGTGLGLPIVRKIIENHGGTVDASSKPGEGACFTVVLPLEPPGDPPGVPAGPQWSPDLPDLE